MPPIIGIGIVLIQRVEGEEHILAFIRKLLKSETNSIAELPRKNV